MITRVAGPATTARRLTTEPAKSAPPHPFAQPNPSRIPAATAITQAGRYTRDESANLTGGAPRGRHARPLRACGRRVGSTIPVDTTVVPSRPRAVRRTRRRCRRWWSGVPLAVGGLHGHHVPGAAEGVDAVALGLLGRGVAGEPVERQAGRRDLVGGAGRGQRLDALGGLHLGARGDGQRRPRAHARIRARDGLPVGVGVHVEGVTLESTRMTPMPGTLAVATAFLAVAAPAGVVARPVTPSARVMPAAAATVRIAASRNDESSGDLRRGVASLLFVADLHADVRTGLVGGLAPSSAPLAGCA